VDAATLGGLGPVDFAQRGASNHFAVGQSFGAPVRFQDRVVHEGPVQVEAGLQVGQELVAAMLRGDGAGLTNLNPAHLVGVLGSEQLAGRYTNAVEWTHPSNRFEGAFQGDGAGLSNLSAAQLYGVLPEHALAGTYTQPLRLTNAANEFEGSFVGRGSSLTDVDAATLGGLGPVDFAQRGASNHFAVGQSFGAPVRFLDNVLHEGPVQVEASLQVGQELVAAMLRGDGAGLTNLNPVHLVGVLGSEHLSGRYTNAVEWTHPSNRFEGAFQGDGAGLSNLPAARLQGPLPDPALAGTYSQPLRLTNGANEFEGTFVGSGRGLTGVDAATLNGLTAPSFWRVGGNAETAAHGHFLGTTDDQPLEFKVNNQRALRLEPTDLSGVNLVGGWSGNSVAPGVVGATVAGGGAGNYYGLAWTNRVDAHFGTVSGGRGNLAGGPLATIAGGHGNTIGASTYSAAIGGGSENAIQANAAYATVPGGRRNLAGGSYSLAAGHRAKANHHGAFVWADATDSDFASTGANQFLVRAGGGVGIGTNNPAGAMLNVAGTVRATFLEGNAAGLSNLPASGLMGMISDGRLSTNVALLNGSPVFAGTVTSGGSLTGQRLSVGRGQEVSGDFATVAGGENNTNLASWATISGGTLNLASGPSATVAGGRGNTASGVAATVPGGEANLAAGSHSQAAGRRARAVHDGAFVWADAADADFSSSGPNQFLIRAGGGVGINTTNPAGRALLVDGATAIRGTHALEFGADMAGKHPQAGRIGYETLTPGALDIVGAGTNTTSRRIKFWAEGGATFNGTGTNAQVRIVNTVDEPAALSFAAPFSTWRVGQNKSPDAPNAFDSFFIYQESANATRLLITDTGRVGLGTNSPLHPLHLRNGAYCTAAGVWTSVSDRDAKTDFVPVNPRDVLARVAGLPVAQWRYKVEDAGVKHIGPTAQDFHAAFGLGESDRTIGAVDSAGVALAAIQGLNSLVAEKDAEIHALRAHNQVLHRRLDVLESAVRRLAEMKNAERP
jgi:hypothetical protein